MFAASFNHKDFKLLLRIVWTLRDHFTHPISET